jgi:hypothetical protein
VSAQVRMRSRLQPAFTLISAAACVHIKYEIDANNPIKKEK